MYLFLNFILHMFRSMCLYIFTQQFQILSVKAFEPYSETPLTYNLVDNSIKEHIDFAPNNYTTLYVAFVN
jgi:hypothetical protein